MIRRTYQPYSTADNHLGYCSGTRECDRRKIAVLNGTLSAWTPPETPTAHERTHNHPLVPVVRVNVGVK